MHSPYLNTMYEVLFFFLHVVINYSLSLLSSIPLSKYTIYFIHPPIDGSLSSFEFGAILIFASINTLVPLFRKTCISVGYVPISRIVGS